MDENARNALIEQLAEAHENTANAVSLMTAQMVELGQRVDEIGSRLDEAQKINHETAKRVEQLTAALDRADTTRLAEQVQAVRNAQTKAEDRIGKVLGELQQIEGMKNAMSQLRSEMSKSLSESEHRLSGELESRTSHRQDEARRLAQAYEALNSRVEAVEAIHEDVEALRQRDARLDEQDASLIKRMDELERASAEEAEARRGSEQRLESQFAGLAERMRVADEEMERWREQLRSNDETVRRAEMVSVELKAEGERLKVAHHATVEAQRVAEARLDLTLETLREEIDARWEKNAMERANDEEERSRSRASRAQVVDQALAKLVERTDAEVLALNETIQAGFDVVNRDIADIKHRIGLFVRNIRDAAAEGSEAFDPQLPSDDPGALAPERRQALRRALRARRAAGGN